MALGDLSQAAAQRNFIIKLAGYQPSFNSWMEIELSGIAEKNLQARFMRLQIAREKYESEQQLVREKIELERLLQAQKDAELLRLEQVDLFIEHPCISHVFLSTLSYPLFHIRFSCQLFSISISNQVRLADERAALVCSPLVLLPFSYSIFCVYICSDKACDMHIIIIQMLVYLFPAVFTFYYSQVAAEAIEAASALSNSTPVISDATDDSFEPKW